MSNIIQPCTTPTPPINAQNNPTNLPPIAVRGIMKTRHCSRIDGRRCRVSPAKAELFLMTSTLLMMAMMSLTFFGAMALSLGGCGYSYSKMHGSKFNIGPRLRHYGQHDAATLLFLAQPQSSWRVISRTSHRRQQRYNHATTTTTTTTTTELHASKSTSSEKKDANPPIDLTTLRKLVSQSSELHDKNLALSSISQDQLQSRLSDLERESSTPDFWDASNSARNEVVTREIARYAKLIEEVELWGRLRMDAVGALELLEELLVESSNSSNNSSDNNPQSSSKAAEDEEMIALTMEECESCARQLLDLSQKYELTTLLSGPYDASNCRLVLTAGAGGTEACDWVSMLYRMYSRHATYMDMKMTTLDESAGDVVGYKSVELLVEGTNAYGWFKGEKGAHRLVRLSPFNANNKRQTTFAGVDVIPVLDDEEVRDIDIPEKELEISTMRSGGKGGQNVNKVETGVRIKHVPSGIAVKCTQERSQSMNKQLALGRLKAQLLAIAQEQQLQSLKEIRGDIVEASWGAQIRNYVMQPYKMVKDARSSWETSDVDGVLDGGGSLEEFVGAWLRWTRAKEEKEREEMELEV